MAGNGRHRAFYTSFIPLIRRSVRDFQPQYLEEEINPPCITLVRERHPYLSVESVPSLIPPPIAK